MERREGSEEDGGSEGGMIKSGCDNKNARPCNTCALPAERQAGRSPSGIFRRTSVTITMTMNTMMKHGTIYDRYMKQALRAKHHVTIDAQ